MQAKQRIYVYRHIWPIDDLDRPISALRAEATASLDAAAARRGARLVGEPRWTVAGDRLVCDVPAEPIEPVAGLDRAVATRLVDYGWNDAQIAREYGVSRWTVAIVRRAAGLPPGPGVAELPE